MNGKRARKLWRVLHLTLCVLSWAGNLPRQVEQREDLGPDDQQRGGEDEGALFAGRFLQDAPHSRGVDIADLLRVHGVPQQGQVLLVAVVCPSLVYHERLPLLGPGWMDLGPPPLPGLRHAVRDVRTTTITRVNYRR
eukprot:scaffold680011_cov45-Prasinocladus_malaysianus.AAC.1